MDGAGAAPDGPPRPGVLTARLPADALPPGAEVVPVGADGSFRSTVAAGPVWLCLADERQGATAGPPWAVSGCALADGAAGPVVVSAGSGGVRAGATG